MSENKKISVLGGIVTYNPECSRLLENVKSVYPQVDKLLIVDNGSDNINDFKEALKDYEIEYVLYDENKGIAKALSEIMHYAVSKSYDWVLTLDQDSVAENNIVSTYLKYVNIKDAGILTCYIKDRNFDVPQFEISGEYEVVPHCITSGSFMNVNAYKKTKGYDEDLFIDWVDMDICYEFKIHGYDTVKINFVGLLTEISQTLIKNNHQINNYSSIRRYYRCRNEIIIAHRYPQLYKRCSFIRNFVPSAIKILLYEDKKMSKINNILKGHKDGTNYIRKNNKDVRKTQKTIPEPKQEMLNF